MGSGLDSGLDPICASYPFREVAFRESGFLLSSKPPSEIRERKGREKKQVLLTPCEHFQLTHLLVSSVVSVVI